MTDEFSEQDRSGAAEPLWLAWARELHSVAHNGLLYAQDHYDRERYERVLRITGEMFAAQSDGGDLRPVLDLLKLDNGYLTPKVDVRGVVIQDGQMLLVRELSDDGRWTLPGGWAEPNDSPAKAVEREVLEETGYEVAVRQILAVYDRSDPRHGHWPPAPLYVYKIFFLCEIIGGTSQMSVETGESRFFAEGELPADLSVARVGRSQLVHFFRMYHEGTAAADFD